VMSVYVCLHCMFCLSTSTSPELFVRSSPNFCACYLRPWLGSPLAVLRYVIYFRFMDDIIFAHNGHYGGMCMSLQRVALLCRHAQANAPAASYWFRLVLDEKVLGAEPAMPHCLVCRVFFLVFVTFAYINLYSPKIR